MSGKNVKFSNPDCLPVEHVLLQVTNDGVFKKIKALDPYWVEKRQLTIYTRPASGSMLVLGAVDAWRARMECYLEDLKWLLRLEYHRFWSTVIYHPDCMDMLVSFLQEADPPYMPPHESREVQKLYKDIRKYVLIVFSRLVTNKESKSQWMTKEHMSDVIYNSFLFTVPILWDICLIYGVDNKQHVSRLLTSVFTLQPQYEIDAKAAVSFVNESFKYIILQVNKDYDCEEPPNLPETFKGFSEIRRPTNSKQPDNLTFSILKDLVVHLLDTAMTLRLFIDVYPKCVPIMREINFVSSIVQMYEYGVPQLYRKLQEVGDQMSVSYTEVEQYIDLARSELIDAFKEILAFYKNAIFSGEGNIVNHIEDYLTMMMEGLSEKLMIRDYQACYALHEDIEMLKEAYPDIDTVKTDFILQVIYSNLDDSIPEHLFTTNQEAETNGHLETIDFDEPQTSNQTIDNNIPNKLKEETLIKEVKELLPHLGDGFILKCLQHYGFKSEKVVNVIFEDNLDESLRGLDQTLPIIPEDPLDKLYLETGNARLNVFDGDEFDFKTRDDIDMSRIHFGKRKSKFKNLNQMLDDKTEVKKMSDIYSKYSVVYDEAIYDDEYDDTGYDGIAPPEPDATEQRRPFVTPRALRTKENRLDEEESSEESQPEEDQTADSRNRMDFCRNPEEIRARREANMQARKAKGPRTIVPAAKRTDVVGKPKGQGQEKDVLVSRDKKEKHKSSRANHNRRQGAQWKRSQGMMPS